MLSGYMSIGACIIVRLTEMMRRGADNNVEAQGAESQRFAGKMAERQVGSPIREIAGGSRTSVMMRGAGEQTTR